MLIGREKEIQELIRAYDSEYSEFAVVYGRRRVGKTFLVRETFAYKFTFEHVGVANGDSRTQQPGAGDGAQIDMLIDRADNMVNICEMKFSKGEYVVTQDDHLKIARRENRFSQFVNHKKSINITMITVNGISQTGYWNDIHKSITAEDLFKD